MVIGGAEDKLRQRTILKEFVAVSGGADARIALIPTASSLGDEVVEVYDALFRRLGAGEVIACRPESREEAWARSSGRTPYTSAAPSFPNSAW